MSEKPHHTPGPWKLETVPTQVGICHKIGPFPPARQNDEPSHACIYVDGRYKPTDDPTSLANARLISFAPELLQALKDLTKEINLSKLNIRKDFSLINAHACALKAIHKAEEL